LRRLPFDIPISNIVRPQVKRGRRLPGLDRHDTLTMTPSPTLQEAAETAPVPAVSVLAVVVSEDDFELGERRWRGADGTVAVGCEEAPGSVDGDGEPRAAGVAEGQDDFLAIVGGAEILFGLRYRARVVQRGGDRSRREVCRAREGARCLAESWRHLSLTSSAA